MTTQNNSWLINKGEVLKELKNIVDIYTNHPGGILVHKRYTIKFDVVGEQHDTK